MKKNLYFKIMALITLSTLFLFLFVRFYILDSFKTRLINQIPKSAVDTAYSVLLSYYNRQVSGELKEDDAKRFALDTIRSLRLDNNDYFWIQGLNNKMIMHPVSKSTVGRDLSEIVNSEGKQVFIEMNKAVIQNEGKTWYTYIWKTPDQKREAEKTSYLKLLKGWDWVIGSGMYTEVMEKQVADFFLKIEIIISILFLIFLFLGHFVSKKISQKLLQVSTEVSIISDNLDKVTKNTHESINSLSQIVVEQSAAIEETAAAVNEINYMAEQNVKNANQTLEISESNKSITIQGKTALNDLDHAIASLEKSVVNMSTEITTHNKRFNEIIVAINQIDSKTKIINDIVFQTKLLSFNAAVEAARAGEHGKGFSVVAEEVGKLAIISGTAAKEINELLSDSTSRIQIIVSDTQRIIEELSQETKEKVDQGHDTAGKFYNIFDEMILNINRMNEAVGEMSSASKEQGLGITQINVALTQLNDTGNVNMNSTHEIKKEMDVLSSNVLNLNSSVKNLEKEVKG